MLAEYLRQLPEAFTLLFYAYLSFLVSWPLWLLAERLTPVNSSTPLSNYWFNWKIVFSNFIITPLFTAFAVMIGLTIAGVFGLPGFSYPTVELSLGVPVLDVVLQIIVFFLVSCFLGDFWYYWWHRMQHELPFLWELHKLHHSDEHMNSTTIFRSHFLELGGQALVRGLTVGLVFDLSGAPETLIAVIAAGLLPPLWDYFIHANVRIDALNRLLPFLSTPQYHWIHHSRLKEHQDKNYAIWLPLFDVIFGTYYRPRIDEYPPTGLSSGEKIETLWHAQAGPIIAWSKMLRGKHLNIDSIRGEAD